MSRFAKYIVGVVSVSAVTLYLLKGIAWIGIFMVCGSGVYWLFFRRTATPSWAQSRVGIVVCNFLKAFAFVILVFLCSISARLFLFDLYAINSASMEEAILPGDKVFVNKAAYGPRLPRSVFEIPWINVIFYLAGNDVVEYGPVRDCKRWAGFSKPERGDVIIITSPYDSETAYVKRCIGVPGDRVYMEKGIARKQHRKAWTGNTLLFVDVITSDRYTLMKMIDSLGGEVRDFRLIRSDTPRTLLQVHIVAQRLDALRSSSIVIAVSPTEPGEEIRSNYLERIDSSWNIYDFGPLLVPGKGTTIELNDSTYTMYGETIDKYEGVVIKKIGNIFMCASKAIEHYTFQNDYYFLMGDNRGDSHDSRHYGMVPMQGIEGKVDCILYSTSGDRIEFTRLFKPL